MNDDKRNTIFIAILMVALLILGIALFVFAGSVDAKECKYPYANCPTSVEVPPLKFTG